MCVCVFVCETGMVTLTESQHSVYLGEEKEEEKISYKEVWRKRREEEMRKRKRKKRQVPIQLHWDLRVAFHLRQKKRQR